jgi:Stage III sporulation protein AF (Spore_III_AF).
MMALIKSWITGVAAASLIAAILIALSPPGKSRKITIFASGFMLIVAMIKPVIGFDYSTFSSSVMQYGTMGQEYSVMLKEKNDSMLKRIIEERSAAYISDKATNLGMENITVKVGSEKGDGEYPYPYDVHVKAKYSISQKKALSDYLESEFGVPVSRQYWSSANGN